MTFILQPWQFFFVILVGWVQREQQKIILFYQAELEAVMKAQGKKRLLLTDDQRRLLAVKGKSLGRKALMKLTTIVTPDTILRWHRQLVARKWDYSERRKSVGRPCVEKEIVDIVLRFARENLTWGYDRIQGALANLGHKISDQTVGNILKEHGMERAPQRKRRTTWKTFIKNRTESPLVSELRHRRNKLTARERQSGEQPDCRLSIDGLPRCTPFHQFEGILLTNTASARAARRLHKRR